MVDQEINLPKLINEMKELIENKNDLKDKNLFTTSIIKMCLRSKDYDLNRAYRCGLKYLERVDKKRINIESKDKLMNALQCNMINVCCNKGLNNETIIIFELLNSKEIDDELIPIVISIVLDYLLRDDMFQINGCFIIFDLINLKFKHLSSIRKKLIKKIFLAFEYSIPIKINKLFIICTDKFGQLVFLKYIKKCISKKLIDRMLIFKKNDEYHKLNEFIDLNYLSEKYDGRLKEMKFLNLSLLINESLAYLVGYSFNNTTNYCSLQSENNSEDDETSKKNINELNKLDSPIKSTNSQ